MRMETRGVALGWLCLASLAAAQEQRGEERAVPPPAGIAGGSGGAPSSLGLVPPPPPGPTEAVVRGRFSPSSGAGRDTARVAQARLLSMEDGTARLQFPEGSAVVRRGSVIGGDVVKSVQGRQIILDRPASAANPRGEGRVVATFGPDGRARVRVFWTKDPSAVIAPEVR